MDATDKEAVVSWFSMEGPIEGGSTRSFGYVVPSWRALIGAWKMKGRYAWKNEVCKHQEDGRGEIQYVEGRVRGIIVKSVFLLRTKYNSLYLHICLIDAFSSLHFINLYSLESHMEYPLIIIQYNQGYMLGSGSW